MICLGVFAHFSGREHRERCLNTLAKHGISSINIIGQPDMARHVPYLIGEYGSALSAELDHLAVDGLQSAVVG